MKKYFKLGLATIIPIGFVALILNWIYGSMQSLMLLVLPDGWGYRWWYVFIFIVALFAALILLGALFSLIRPMRWFKKQFDKAVNHIPFVNKIYTFGLEISDALIEDGKFDGKIKVVDVKYAGLMTKGLLTNAQKNHVFIATAPNPMNGFVFITDEYKITDDTMEDYLKFLTSLGKL